MSLRLPALTILFVIGTAHCAHPAEASSPSQNFLDLQGYVAELEKYSAAAGRLKDHPEDAAALQRELPRQWVVTTGGQSYRVSTDWLRERLDAVRSGRGHPSEFSRELVVRLSAMKASAQALETTEPPANDAARRSLDEILKHREYRGVTAPSPFRSWLEQATNWVADKLAVALGGVGQHPRLSTSLVWLLAVAVALFLVTWLVRSVLRTSVDNRLRLEGPFVSETRECARQALACADREDYREAIRLAYWEAIARLEEYGLWQMEHARTPREYLRLLPSDHAQRPPLTALTQRFERTWYGGSRVSAEDFRCALVELGELGCRLHWNQATANSS
jgi:hypothetical protein